MLDLESPTCGLTYNDVTCSSVRVFGARIMIGTSCGIEESPLKESTCITLGDLILLGVVVLGGAGRVTRKYLTINSVMTCSV